MSRRYVAGQREPREPREIVNIDYADVLRQAVENERWNVLREVRTAVERVPDSEQGRSSYSSTPRSGSAVKRDVLAALDRIIDGAS